MDICSYDCHANDIQYQGSCAKGRRSGIVLINCDILKVEATLICDLLIISSQQPSNIEKPTHTRSMFVYR